MQEKTASQAAERAARHSYGKLIAFLSARSRNVAAAEDALSEALATALRVWPRSGVPDNPEAWLLVAARRHLGKTTRHGKVADQAREAVTMALEDAEQAARERLDTVFPDERLKLLFVCTHPAIDRSAHTPLMLQTVLGLDARRIASAFLISPSSMGQRLVRAKAKIRDAGIPFSVPDAPDLPARLGAVLSAIYAAYALGWDGIDGNDEKRMGLSNEAIWLARTLLSIMPERAEVMGLLALMLYSEARQAARRDGAGIYIPLDEQDVALWDIGNLREADALMLAAARLDDFGPYQCEAAIQSVHCDRHRTGTTNWPAIATLYDALIHLRPTIGAHVGRAAVVAQVQGPLQGLACLDALNTEDIGSYQPYWAVRAHILQRAERTQDAADAYRRAIGLSESPAVRRFLQQKLEQTVISR